VLALGDFAVFGKFLKNGAFAWIWEKPPLVENAATH